MIIGLLSELENQKNILPEVVFRTLQTLDGLDLTNMELGRYEIEGDKLFYLIQETMPRFVGDCLTEAHVSYADIHLPLTARERFGVAFPQAGLVAVDDRMETNDIAFYPTPDNESFVDIDPGAYAFFPPEELHRPCVVVEEQKSFRKIVVKIHRSLLSL